MKKIITLNSQSIETMPLDELKFRIQLGNFVLRWLRSNDPMLYSERYKHMVQPAIERYDAEVREMVEVCRRRDLEAGENGNEDERVIGLKSAKMKARKL